MKGQQQITDRINSLESDVKYYNYLKDQISTGAAFTPVADKAIKRLNDQIMALKWVLKE